MINRTLKSKLLALRKQFPILGVFGPRQSGKTTLVKDVFPEYRYINLESFEEREFAQTDGKGFLNRLRKEKGVILDEIQKVPSLFSYLQLEVDENPTPGRFILTGSQNILLNQRVSQTLAGRIALTTLLPFSIEELRVAKHLPENAIDAIFKGFYPRVHDANLDPVVFAESYVRTYVERDVRDIKQVVSLTEFQTFMRLCAARVGQLLNLSSLCVESGLSLPTVKSWLSILEASYILFFLQPYYEHFNKRTVKMPKLYFYDTALCCHLLRLTKADDVYEHYLKGGLFESMILSNLLKKQFHHCLPPNIYFWRDKTGNEVDCIIEEGAVLTPIEIKSSATIQANMFSNLVKWSALAKTKKKKENLIIYAGEEEQKRQQGQILSWKKI